MKESGYYPSGAEFDKNAPYNEPLPMKPKEFCCKAIITLEKEVKVPTQNYREYYEKDEDGFGFCEIDTQDIDWEEEYKDNCITIDEMLDTLKIYVQKELKATDNNSRKCRRLKELLEACSGWKVIESFVDEL